MKFSTKTRYGLRILVQIAASSKEKEFIQGKEIAKAQSITEPYLEQIMISLKNGGMVKTARGRSGGYALKKTPAQITLLEIIELFEGPLALADCVDDKKSCRLYRDCAARKVWETLSLKFRDAAKNISIEEILKEKKSEEYFI
jgi:Rrf2 family protein